MFDIEGGCALNETLSMVELYYELGVRWMLIAYNRNNALGGGCQDDDQGLTDFGRKVLDEMARVGMVACCSHTGFRTTMDVMEYSSNPVIFSHSNPFGIKQHPRNIKDEAIKASAKSGGVVGINGIGDFLGDNDDRTETIVRHIDYVVQLVGPEHVGISLDYVFDQQELDDYIKDNPETFPPELGYGPGLKMVRPEQIPEITECLLGLGYSDHDMRLILGENHLRIAKQVWA
jgi:membrane dipeptidase